MMSSYEFSLGSSKGTAFFCSSGRNLSTTLYATTTE